MMALQEEGQVSKKLTSVSQHQGYPWEQRREIYMRPMPQGQESIGQVCYHMAVWVLRALINTEASTSVQSDEQPQL
jgi:hypothetical protein